MKNLILLSVMAAGIFLATGFTPISDISQRTEINYKTDYCEGWEEGYCEGWKDTRGKYSICPIAPICPVPEIGKDRYKDGYNRGFKKGMKDADK